MKKLAIILLAVAALSGCVYEFTPEILTEDLGGLVVEGDIIIGDVSYFSLSSVEPLSGAKVAPVRGFVWVEDDSGQEYHPAVSGASSTFEIDMTKASPDRKYRLRIQLGVPVAGGHTNYSSEWKEVQMAPNIDEISYSFEPEEYGKPLLDKNIHLTLSLSSPGGSGCFRWDYEEIWEFHPEMMATWYFDPADNRKKMYSGIPPLYYCWSYAYSTQAGLAIAKSTGGERIIGYEFYDFDRRDLRLQLLYYIKLKARNISEECYEYLHTIEVNSTNTGSLTQPDPSQIVGNIFCDDDPLEVVYGYIEVSRMVYKSIYIPNSAYISPKEAIGEQELPPPVSNLGIMTPLEAWENGMRLYDSPNSWVAASCVECTALGGTKNKPDFWPTNSE